MIIKKYGKIESGKPKSMEAKCPYCNTVVVLEDNDLHTNANSDQYWTCPFCTHSVEYEEYISFGAAILYFLGVLFLLPFGIMVTIGKWSVDAIRDECRIHGPIYVVGEIIILVTLFVGLIVISLSTLPFCME